MSDNRKFVIRECGGQWNIAKSDNRWIKNNSANPWIMHKPWATAGRRYSAGRWHIPSKRIHVHPMLTMFGNTDYKLMDKIPLCLQLRASLWTVPHLIANGMSGQFGVPAPSHVSVESDKDLEKSWKRTNMAASHAREIPKSLSHAMTFLVQDQVRGEYKVIKIF